jgi:hypothetical protein
MEDLQALGRENYLHLYSYNSISSLITVLGELLDRCSGASCHGYDRHRI